MEDFYTIDPLSNKTRPTWLVQAVDQLLFKVRNNDIWDTVDLAISVWSRKHPVEYRKFLDANKEYKKSRKNKFASTEDKSFRHLLNLPGEVSYVLEKLAQHRIKEYGRQKFWREFARRYPGFATAEKI